MTATLEAPSRYRAGQVFTPGSRPGAAVSSAPRRPFDRLPHETPHQYALLCRYLDPSKVRDLWKMAEENTPGTQEEKETEHRRLQGIAKLNRWTERAHAYDAAQAALVQMAEEKAAKQLADEWLTKARDLKREQMAVAEKMLARAKEMLAFPLAKKRVQSETGITEIHPAKWTFADAAKLVDTANKLLCLATGQATENIAVAGTVTTKPAAPAYNLDALSLDELETFRALLAKATPGTIAPASFDAPPLDVTAEARPDDHRAGPSAEGTPGTPPAPTATQNGPAPAPLDGSPVGPARQDDPTAAPAGSAAAPPLDAGPQASPQGQAAQADAPTAPAPGPCKAPAPCRDDIPSPAPYAQKVTEATPPRLETPEGLLTGSSPSGEIVWRVEKNAPPEGVKRDGVGGGKKLEEET